MCRLSWNQFTIKNRYLLPIILGLLDHLSHAKVYTKVDLCGTYNLVRIRESNECKTSCKTCYNHFEYVVMPFGLTNLLEIITLNPKPFQHLYIFHEYLDDFMVYYIDDILMFSKNMEDHKCHVHLVLEKLSEVEFYAKLKKCEFHQYEMEFLGYVIFGNGIHMDPCKV